MSGAQQKHSSLLGERLGGEGSTASPTGEPQRNPVTGQAADGFSAQPGRPAGAAPAGAAPDLDWTAFKAQVHTVLTEYFQSHTARARAYSPAFGVLWEQMAEATLGGKWMRPKLVYLAYGAFGGGNWRAGAELAAAFEVLHAALLVHDDVIDRDFVRRGAPTLGAAYRDMAATLGQNAQDAEHAGFAAAIIAGDLLLTGSLRLAGTAAKNHPNSALILGAVHEAIFASAAGELDDLLFSLGGLAAQMPEVLKMERLKTAVYSFETPLRAGALLAGESVSTADALATVGRDIGIAYQVIDDVLGTFGQSSETGKSVDSDLREGKRTILTTYAAGSPEFAAMLESFRNGQAQTGELREVLHQIGARNFAVELAESLINDALGRAVELELPPTLYAELSNICDYVLTRRN
ncbi:polyprenyl synthetase family protein [Specibacter sp. NPDC057265]|uniref:polyprenyl synthetase family protein n=1 Tax=Specibacter sp. NPDC057265 TaxID=3346075 RepID=UPI0036397BDC